MRPAYILVLISCGYLFACSPPKIEGYIFSSARDGNWEIYWQANEQTQTPINLTRFPTLEKHPALSPDGKTIAFVSSRDNDYEIYLINPDGNNLTRLSQDPHMDSYPTWSPDSQKLAFVSDRDYNDDIFVMSRHSKAAEAQQLTKTESQETHPAWSPDGQKIAFVSNRDGNDEIYWMKPDGSGVERLTQDPAHDSHPAWSPNSQKLAFVSNRTGVENIHILDLKTKQTQALSPAKTWQGHPAWKDQNTVLFSANASGDFELYSASFNGSGPQRLTTYPGQDSEPLWAVFSP